jgi:K+-transporting ATPase ATPase C chain
MLAHFKTSLISLVVLTLLTGIVYPLAVTAIGKVAFPRQVEGSLIERNGKVIGSSLIGQAFADPRHFWGRPSATSPYGYNATSSSGSNQGPTNPALAEAVAARVKALRDADPTNQLPVPVDLVTASGSGLDPHISLASAYYQVGRVAKARGLDAAKVRALVAVHTEERQLGFLGEPRVNVLELNLDLDNQ